MQSIHMHILFFVSLHKRLKVRGKSVINDRQVALANSTLLSLSRLINNPTQLLTSCLPTCERDSAQTCTDYSVRDHAIYKSASKLVATSTGGFWGLVLESRNDPRGDESDRRRRATSNGCSDDNEDSQDDTEADIMAVASRDASGRPSGRNRGRGRGGIHIKKEKSAKSKDDDRLERGHSRHAPSSSPLTEAEEDDDDDDDEVVDKNAWFLLDWTIDLWIRSRMNSKGMFLCHFFLFTTGR